MSPSMAASAAFPMSWSPTNRALMSTMASAMLRPSGPTSAHRAPKASARVSSRDRRAVTRRDQPEKRFVFMEQASFL